MELVRPVVTVTPVAGNDGHNPSFPKPKSEVHSRTSMAKWRRARGALSIVLALACSPCAAETLSRQDVAAIEHGLVPRVIVAGTAEGPRELHERMKQTTTPSLSVALFRGGEVIWAQGYGTAAPGHPVDVHTRFQAASISKSVTAFATLMLVDANRLDLDRDVNDYLKSWKIPASPLTRSEKVTIRRLLSHIAGLNVDGFPGYEKSAKIPDAAGVLDGKGNSPALKVEAVPGTRYSYSGGGYVVLQKLIEDQSGLSFAQYMRSRLLSPLHMDDSTFDSNPSGDVSLAYDFKGKPYPGGWHVYPELGPAGLWTTPSDLAKFSQALQDAIDGAKGALLPQSLARQMIVPSGIAGGGDGYGLGIEVQGSGKDARYGHGGSNAGFKSEWYFFPERKLGLVVMTNSENGRVVRNELMRSISNKYELGLFPPRTVTRIDIERDKLMALAGSYRYKDEDEEVPFRVTVTDEGDVTLENLGNGKVNHLMAIGSDAFIDPDTGEEASVVREAKTGKIQSLLYDREDTLTRVR
ncbi:class A beta-lactamase-related serine hydrolase [Dyella choica]|uniref:Class A beta-lactamase-related serine hydrolase n=2 Tax=Dyella choica TaxID=1927959 RepID=A0A3S0S2F2_9GAMM|nr:class A beta-lactamase-related serine hydrolase [Dyella choica]